jgi:5-methylcytosine-specific restriction endonuclease McrA
LNNYYLWKETYPERRAEASSNYQKKNRAYYAEYRARRRFSEQQATPSWSDISKLHEVYKKAKELGLEVDHIIPLKNELVCGLHVPDNLQLLSRTENAKKCNKFDIDVQVKVNANE